VFGLKSFFQIFVAGLAMGGIYVLGAMGMSLIFGVMRVINVAHGAFYMLGCVLTFVFINLGFNVIVCFLPITGIIFIIGILVQKFLVKPVMKIPLNVAILTIGLALAIEEIVRLTLGPDLKSIPPFFKTGSLSFFSIDIDMERLVSSLISILLISLLLIVIKKTRTGKAIRMVQQDGEMARALGIRVERINMIVFGLGVALVGVSGILLSPLYVLFPAMGWIPLLRCFAIVTLGGMGSLGGSIIAGFIFGLVEIFSGYYISSQMASISIFLVMVIVLIIKPQGLFGAAE
jgi:branched-chain amino acid transport system permease protein